MRTHELAFQQLSQEGLEWLKEKYTAVDQMDPERYRTFLAEDCKLMFGNQPVVFCNDEIIGGIVHFWELINGLDHSFLAVYGDDTHFAAEAMIDYTRKDGNTVKIPCVTVIERNAEGLATFIKIYIDTAPIFN